MPITAIVILIILGIILLLVEFLIIPGITIAGIKAFILFTGGIVSAYYYHGVKFGNYVTLATIFCIVMVFIFTFRSKTWNRMGLNAASDSKLERIKEEKISVGSLGKTISKLSPIGKAIFEQKVVEVRSNGNYINTNTEIVVIRIEGFKIFVEEANSKTDA